MFATLSVVLKPTTDTLTTKVSRLKALQKNFQECTRSYSNMIICLDRITIFLMVFMYSGVIGAPNYKLKVLISSSIIIV